MSDSDDYKSRDRSRADQQAPARVRVLYADGHRWRVWEAPYPSMDRRSGTCLIFDAEAVIRRVRNFPPDWHELGDGELYALSLKA